MTDNHLREKGGAVNQSSTAGDAATLAAKFEELRAAYKAGRLVKDTKAFKEFCFANSDQISIALRSTDGPGR